MQFTLESALQKTGDATLGDQVEKIWFNAAQGSRLPDGKAVSYLTSDNRLHCDGMSPDGSQMIWRFATSSRPRTPTLRCAAPIPNATQVASLFVRGMWMRHSRRGLVALLYGPCSLSTLVEGVPVQIEERTNYPFDHEIEFEDSRGARNWPFPFIFCNPSWSAGTRVQCSGASIQRQGAYWVVQRSWRKSERLRLTFTPVVQPVRAVNSEMALQYGPLIFARPIDAKKMTLKSYPVPGFEDAYYEPVAGNLDVLSLSSSLRSRSFGFKPGPAASDSSLLRPFDAPVIALTGTMHRQTDGTMVAATLVPLGNVPTLRRVSFPVDRG